jgi:putative transposase
MSWEHVPERDRPQLRRRLRSAWALDDPAQARERLTGLAIELERQHPGAASSLREGLHETLTLQRLGITGQLKRTLESTNPIESMIEIVGRTQRNVKRWSPGEMALRWTAAGLFEAERQLRRVIGYKQLAALAMAVEREMDRSDTSTEEVATPRPCLILTPGPPSEVLRRAGHPPPPPPAQTQP